MPDFQRLHLQPAAGAQGEFVGVMIIRAYHKSRGDYKRTRILIPDSAHGTNPASSAMSGFEIVHIPTDEFGNTDLEALKAACDDQVAGLMLTNPNTLGLFDCNIKEVIEVVHECGGLVYGDGANMNALLGITRPGDLGIDVMHFNLHKTFSTPHGGGGPGAGPVGVLKHLEDFLPYPVIDIIEEGEDDTPPLYGFKVPKQSIGRVKSFHGQFGMSWSGHLHISACMDRKDYDKSPNWLYLMPTICLLSLRNIIKSLMTEFVCTNLSWKVNGTMRQMFTPWT